MAVSIVNVSRGTPAYKAGLRSGMLLMRIDGHEIRDGLDYEFYSSPAAFPVVVMHGDSEITYHVKKQEYEPLGCEFASYLIDKHHSCCNKCVFCFIDQMPKGMRPSLYFKDDDERLSFLFGNYVTLTNL
ncbi:MAG: radical SAM protein, partial [Oscillospiraceae bacterium]